MKYNAGQGVLSRISHCITKSEQKPKNIFCLGCGVKVSLNNVLYPALAMVNRKLRGKSVQLVVGNDAHVFETEKKIAIKRKLHNGSLSDNSVVKDTIQDIRQFKPHSAILLASYLENPPIRKVGNSLAAFCQPMVSQNMPLLIGKGHTIQISKVPAQEFILADYVVSEKGGYYGVASNDTIVSVDFNLRHSHWINVYTALNNALNDLYALGVYKDVAMYPSYDSIYEKDNKNIRSVLKRYIGELAKYNYTLHDRGPFGLNLEAVGSTVVGITDREPPRATNLIPEQVLIVTRPIGDLSLLVLYICNQMTGTLSRRIRNKKMDVLRMMVTSNIEIGRLIASYLPPKGECFNPQRHITCTKDISGEGIAAFSELALQSKVDIHLNALRLHAEESSILNVPNNTSNTNGAIIISAHQTLAREIVKRLKEIGCDPWIAGRVGEKSRTPTIFVQKTLCEKYVFLQKKSKMLFRKFRVIENEA